MQAQGDHRIVQVGEGKMVLFDSEDAPLVIAERQGYPGHYSWTVKAADGSKTVHTPLAEVRRDAVDAMIDMALELSPGEGYSTFVPGRVDQFGNYICLRNEP